MKMPMSALGCSYWLIGAWVAVFAGSARSWTTGSVSLQRSDRAKLLFNPLSLTLRDAIDSRPADRSSDCLSADR